MECTYYNNIFQIYKYIHIQFLKTNTLLECFTNVSNRHEQIQYITCSSFNITRLLMKFRYNVVYNTLIAVQQSDSDL